MSTTTTSATDDGKRSGKRSKAFYRRACSVSKRMRRDNFLEVGMRGFILTCNHGEQPCVREAYCLLGEYADNLYGAENVGAGNGSDSNNDSDTDIEASLKKEVAEMKQQLEQKETRFQSISSGARNVAFIKTELPNPTELVHYLLTDIAANQMCKSCHIIRMLPVNKTCLATIADITKEAPEILFSYFHADGVEPTTFAVQIKIRNNGVVKRDDVINVLAGVIVGKGIKHKVNLDEPELTVIVQIIKNICCLSVVRDYNKLKKYNLHAIVDGRGVTKKDNRGRYAKKIEGTASKSDGDTESNNEDTLKDGKQNESQQQWENSETKKIETFCDSHETESGSSANINETDDIPSN